MRRFPSVVPVLSLALAAGALTLAACSDGTTGPTRRASSSPDLSVVAGPGANTLTIASDASTQLCPTGQVNGDYTVPASYAPILAGCVAAPSLMPALAVYNPGWDAPITGSSWIGPTANSSDYRTTPGRFVFQETFTLPAGVTNPSLHLTSMADNVVAVYLNGHLVGTQTVQDCNTAPCNWSVAGQLTLTDNTASDFVIGGTNILTVLLIDTPIGFPLLTGPLGGPAPNYGCARPVQPNGSAGFGTPQNVPTSPAHVVANRQSNISNLGAANQSGCENPTGVDYKGTVSWTVPPPPQVCDFITFGRLVVEVGGDKIVISGNAGGNAPDGGILGTIEISVGGTQYHVPTIETYAHTASGVLFPDPFARVITGHSDSHLIELRLRDNPNPGQGEPTDEGDKVWLKIDNNVIVPLQTPDQGNIQLHLNCRGPGE